MGADPYTQAAGSAIGIYSDVKGAQQAGNAAQQDTNSLNQIVGGQEGAINGLLKSYFGPGGGAADISKLANWNGLKPAEISNLQGILGNNTSSMIRTMQTQLGGTANPGMLEAGLASQGQQQGLELASNLGANAAQQELGALTSAAGLSQSGLQLGMEGASGLMGMFNQNANQAAQNKQNDISNIGSNVGGLGSGIQGMSMPTGGNKGGGGGGAQQTGPAGFGKF